MYTYTIITILPSEREREREMYIYIQTRISRSPVAFHEVLTQIEKSTAAAAACV